MSRQRTRVLLDQLRVAGHRAATSGCQRASILSLLLMLLLLVVMLLILLLAVMRHCVQTQPRCVRRRWRITGREVTRDRFLNGGRNERGKSSTNLHSMQPIQLMTGERNAVVPSMQYITILLPSTRQKVRCRKRQNKNGWTSDETRVL